jgi:DNA-binding MarR family transcriptional regulator
LRRQRNASGPGDAADALELLSPAEGMAWGGFLRAHAVLVARLDAELREAHDLPLTWYDVLWQLDLAGDAGLRLSALAERVLLTLSGISRLVDRLEGEGLVARVPDTGDGRATCAVLTPAGRRRLVAAHPTHVAGIRRHVLSRLSAEEQRLLGRVWRRLLGEGTP